RLDEDTVLVRRLLPPAREAPRDEQSTPIEHAHARVRVADLDDEQHHRLLSPSEAAAVPDTKRVTGPSPESTSSAPVSSTSTAKPSPPPGIRTRSPSVLARRRHASRREAKPFLSH